MRIKKAYLFIILASAITCCVQQEVKELEFNSNFYSPQKQTWIGPEYWSNPMQDWQIENGSLTCLVSGSNRNVHLLTQKLDTIRGDFKMSVNLRIHNLDTLEDKLNWLGFSLGSQGEFNDYRDDAVFGKGLNVGITTNGILFIGSIEDSTGNATITPHLEDEISLVVVVSPDSIGYKMVLSLFGKNQEQPLQQISKNEISSEELTGDVVLVSDYSYERGDPSKENRSASYRNWHVSGTKLRTDKNNSFGPILFSQYTLSKRVLKLTAQMAPVENTSEEVFLQIKKDVIWETIGSSKIDIEAKTAVFAIKNWPIENDIDYRLKYKYYRKKGSPDQFYWQGTIRKDPVDKDEIIIAGFTGNDHLGFPNTDIVKQIEFHDPDLLFFSGDQIYEPNGGYGAQRAPLDKAMLDYLRKWYLYGWAYRDLMKDRPTVSITDDHDVYHGNIWGAGGRPTPADYGQGSKAQDAGGYKMPAQWVKMVERTQTSHLPDPYDPTPVNQGIGAYYTDMVYGGVSFAILEDRKFKSAPKELLPDAEIANGWPQNKKFNMIKDGDVDGAKLLGERQLDFLDHWALDWSNQAEMKVLLSQTIFANVATLPREAMSGAIIPTLRIMHEGDYPVDDKPVTDLDSNGWPQSGRNKAVSTIRKGYAFHLAGDQHLGSTIQYGLDDWNDSGFAFCVPSISNHWPRRWYPADGGMNRDPDQPKYTGENKDGFGNKITVHAVSNPLFTGKEPARLYDRAAGYGIVRLLKNDRKIILECWPRQANPELGAKEQYDGWPITLDQEENYGRKAVAYLPEIRINNLQNPVILIINDATGETIYGLRINQNTFTPKIFDATVSYSIKVGEPDTDTWQTKEGIKPGDGLIEYHFK